MRCLDMRVKVNVSAIWRKQIQSLIAYDEHLTAIFKETESDTTTQLDKTRNDMKSLRDDISNERTLLNAQIANVHSVVQQVASIAEKVEVKPTSC